jgi:hypothetical protein
MLSCGHYTEIASIAQSGLHSQGILYTRRYHLVTTTLDPGSTIIDVDGELHGMIARSLIPRPGSGNFPSGIVNSIVNRDAILVLSR